MANEKKPDCILTGEDGNIFNLIGVVGRTLRDNNQGDKVREMQSRVMSSGSYNEALGILGEYVNVL